MALSDNEQREVLDYLRWLAAPGTGELRKLFYSRSGFREPGEGPIDTITGIELNADGNLDFLATESRARLGYPPAIARLNRVAKGEEPGRNKDDALLARAVLASLKKTKTVAPVVVNDASTDTSAELTAAYAEIARLNEENSRLKFNATQHGSAELVQSSTTATTVGAQIGQVYDALESLRLADALPIESRAPLQALISVLSTKNGSQL